MASFLRNLFNKLAPPRGPAPRELFLAAFGKHPGWDDHVEIGLDTERLTVVKRLLYSDGIGGNIESGVWEKMREDQRLPGFDHVFVWRAPDNIVVGRLWSSRDGKGRSRYPMVVCAQSGMHLGWVVRTILPGLEKVQRECTQTTSAAAVSELLNSVRNDLRLDAATARTFFGRTRSQAIPKTRADRSDSTGADNGLPSILYHLERELGAGDLPLQASGRKVRPVRTAHLRLPEIAGFPAGGAVPWINLVLNFVTPETSVLALRPNNEPWVDLIVGEPSAAQLFCLLASPAAIPLTTEIPYQLDEAFLSRTRAFIANRRPNTEADVPLAGKRS